MVGPVFRMEAVTHARRLRYFGARIAYGSILLTGVWVNYAAADLGPGSMTPTAASMLAETFFLTFTTLQLLTLMFIAPAVASGALASERERGTLEYLFTTDLSNREIVVGKFLIRFLLTAFQLLVGLPILAIIMLIGGIAPGKLVLCFVITLSSTLFVLAVTLWFSAHGRRTRDVVTRVYIILVAIWGIPLLFALPFPWTLPNLIAQLNHALLVTNPLGVLLLMPRGAIEFGAVVPMLSTHLIGTCVCLTLSVWRLRKHETVSNRTSTRRWFRIRPKLGRRPMIWKELFVEPAGQGLGLWATIAMGAIITGVMIPTIHQFSTVNATTVTARSHLEFSAVMAGLTGFGILVLAAARSSTSVSTERERDCWVSLTSTPLTASEIFFGKLLGNLYALRSVIAVWLLIWILAVIVSPSFIVSFALVLVANWILLLFVITMGLTYSLFLSGSIKSLVSSVLTLLGVGGGYLFCCIPASRGSSTELVLTLCIPFLQVFPAIVHFDSPGNVEAELIAAFLFGLIIYGVAALTLSIIWTGNFEAAIGRPQLSPLRLPPPLKPASSSSDQARLDD